MHLDILSGELERLFDLDELQALSIDLLGFDPSAVGGTTHKGSFARALTAYCVAEDAVEALCDALLATKKGVDPRVVELRQGALSERPLEPGDQLGAFTIVRPLGRGRVGNVYVASDGASQLRLKLLHLAATRDRRNLHRCLTRSRLIGRFSHAGVAHQLRAERLGERYTIAHEWVDGQTLGARLAFGGPMPFDAARPFLSAILRALEPLHDRGLAHGNLHLENVIVASAGSADTRVVLVDAGCERLRTARPRNAGQELFSTGGCPNTLAPEQIRGKAADARSDVYAFGALTFQLLSGHAPFSGTDLEVALAHLGKAPPALARVAPRGWVSEEVERFILDLLAKDPDARPQTAGHALELIGTLDRRDASGKPSEVDDTTLTRSIEALLEEPASEGLARDLERLVDLGADPARVADAFVMGADVLDDPQGGQAARTQLLLRAARLYEAKHETLAAAEKAYVAALELAPGDELVLAGLEEVRKRAGKHEELIEMLLQRNERTRDPHERAQTFAEIGRIYVRALDDREQALVAFTHAFVEEPLETTHVVDLHEVAGSDERAWTDVLGSLEETLRGGALPAPTESAIRLKMAEWYQALLGRLDLQSACLELVLEADPTNDAALESLSSNYRRAQRWRDLGAVLLRRADRAPAPLARDLRAEAAEVLEHQLGDTGAARDLYEQVFATDPSHRRAAEGLTRICERSEDYPALAHLLSRRAEALGGEERLKQLCRLAEVQDTRLGDREAAISTYESVLAVNPEHQEALRGLDQVLVRAGRHRDLLGILEREVELSATPRQKIALQERVATLYEQEFLDHEHASLARELILQWDRSNQEALARLLGNYRALGRWERLSEAYERLLELTPEPARRVELALAWGRLLSEELQAPERAASAYELVLEVAPNQADALDALARLSESTGDATRAIDAVLALADTAATPHEKARQLERAAKLFEAHENLERAIEVYEQAVDVEPENASLRKALRDAYVERGDVVLALELFERELSRAEGDHAKARLASQMARLARDRLHDDERAEAAAKQALGFDPTDLEGLAVLGDLAYEQQRFVEANRYFEAIAGRLDTLAPAEAKRILLRSIEALARTDKWQKAAGLRERLLALSADDAALSEQVAHLTLEFGDTQTAATQYKDLLARFENELPQTLLALAECRYGEALYRSGQRATALGHFERASELDPSLDQALSAQARLQAELAHWPAVVAIKQRQLETAAADGHFQLWADIGDIAHEHLHDRAKAAESYIRALEVKPDERRVLSRLMQLYSEDEQWEKLVEVVLKLASFVDDASQKAKYLETAAVVTAQQIGNKSQALEYYERAFALQPSQRALDEAIEIYRAESAPSEVERLLRQRLELCTKDGNKDEMLATFSALADLYEHDLGDVDNAIDAHEAAQTLDPSNETRADVLTELYGTDLERYAARAVKLHGGLIELNPRRVSSYRALRRVYAATRDVDASWCLCQTLSVLGLADADERRFYARSKVAEAAPIQHALSDEDWLGSVLHPLVDPLLTSVFALIEPAVIESRAEPLEAFGYTEGHRVTLDNHYAALSQSLHHASGALGVPLPPVYENTNDPGGLSFLHTFEPAVVLGNAALNAEVPSQAAAFIAARHLSYLRPGLYLRQLVGTGTGLKSWLFAAIQLTAPQFPTARELEGPISEALEALRQSLPKTARDHLTRVVAKMLQSGAALDLKRWIAGVDLTADRAGFLLANDLETGAAILEVSDDSASAVPSRERYRQLVIWSVSAEYFALRKKLGVALER